MFFVPFVLMRVDACFSRFSEEWGATNQCPKDDKDLDETSQTKLEMYERGCYVRYVCFQTWLCFHRAAWGVWRRLGMIRQKPGQAKACLTPTTGIWRPGMLYERRLTLAWQLGLRGCLRLSASGSVDFRGVLRDVGGSLGLEVLA